MTIKEMHYDFKKKLNKVDSQQYRNLLIPEIDWVLNEAQNVFVDMIAQPRIKTYLGFEKSQKNTDDIRTLVVDNQCSDVSHTENISGENPSWEKRGFTTLPDDYRYFVNAECTIIKPGCNEKTSKVFIREHDDDFENSPFDKSSFEWNTVNATFSGNEITLFSDTTFQLLKFCLSYIRNPRLIHNAEDFRNGSYKLPSGVSLTGSVDCELPVHTHREIVDIAVLITTGEIQAPDYQIKYAKLGLNHLK